MTDDNQEQELPESVDSGRSQPSPGVIRTTLAKRDSKGRPIAVYGILGIGVATLLVLMLVIYIWSGDRGKPDQIICTSITPQRAIAAIRDGEVQKLTLAYDRMVESSADQRWGPVLGSISYTDGQCANLPQGVTNQNDVLSILGAIAFYNETTESAQVEVVYNPMTELDPALFTTPTQIPTETPVPTEAPEPTNAPVSTPAATPPATEAATEILVGPAASPAATPRTGTATPTP